MVEEHNNQEQTAIAEPGTVGDKVDQFLDGLEKPQETSQEDSSPEETQPEGQPEAGGEPDKDTQSTEGDQDFEGLPKGFANHPAWQKLIKQKNEAVGKVTEFERLAKERDELLNDPAVYRRYLEKQGLSEAQVKDRMQEKGFVEPRAKEPEGDVVEQICKRLNWDATALNSEQKSYLKDQLALIEAAAEQLMDKKLASRLEKVESRFSEIDNRDKMRVEYDEVVKQAKTEFPDLDWEKDIHPALVNYLNDLDKKDPDRKQTLDFTTLYERATRQLLREKRQAVERQEERNEKKKNARPLQPGANPPESKKGFRGKSVAETVDNLLDHYGIRD